MLVGMNLLHNVLALPRMRLHMGELLDLLFTKQEQMSSVVLKSNISGDHLLKSCKILLGEGILINF